MRLEHRYSSPDGPIFRYTVAIGLPQQKRVVKYRSTTSQGPHHAAAGAVMGHLRRNPSEVIGSVDIENVEGDFVPEIDDLVDYWDVA